MSKSKESNTIARVSFARTVNLTHLFSVDDVLLSRNGLVEELFSFNDIIYLFYEAYGIDVSKEKSCFIIANVDESERVSVVAIINYKMAYFMVGFKYIGFNLKPCGHFERLGVAYPKDSL